MHVKPPEASAAHPPWFEHGFGLQGSAAGAKVGYVVGAEVGEVGTFIGAKVGEVGTFVGAKVEVEVSLQISPPQNDAHLHVSTAMWGTQVPPFKQGFDAQ